MTLGLTVHPLPVERVIEATKLRGVMTPALARPAMATKVAKLDDSCILLLEQCVLWIRISIWMRFWLSAIGEDGS